jgi:RNA polymerase sigma-70 factor (ECF subfamily)
LDEEARLIRRIQKTGSRDAADTLVRKYYDEIYIYVYKQTSDKYISMDLTQTIFTSMLQSISNYDEKQAGFRTWLYRIATNKTIDYHRSREIRKNRVLDVGDFDIPDEREFTREIEMRDLLSRLQAYVNTLDVETQQIFRLKFFGEHAFSQIAALLSLLEPTVKSKYYRLLKQLRKEFQNEYSDA